MYYTFAFVLVITVNISLTGAYNEWSQSQTPYNTYGTDVINIGNGVNRRNTVILDQTGAANPTEVNKNNNRFYGASPNQPNPPVASYPSSVNNIGNGYANRNTVVAHRGGRPGNDVFNIGYGPDNQNKVFYNGRPQAPTQTNSWGQTYKLNTNNGGETIHVLNTVGPIQPFNQLYYTRTYVY